MSLTSTQQLFLDWCIEREHIRLRREQGQAPPWTKDPVLQEYRFCNVRRSDDRVTRWINEWLWRHRTNERVWLVVAVARLINEPDMLARLEPIRIMDGDGAHIRRRIAERQQLGLRVYNPAYIVVPHGEKMPKDEFIARMVTEMYTHHVSRPIAGLWSTCEEAHRALCSIKHLGSFTSAQVIADLKLLEGQSLSEADDRLRWAAPGPGSMRGLNRWHERHITESGFIDALLEVAETLRPLVCAEHPQLEDMDMQDWQNVCCECDKYLRALLCQGRPRQRYARRNNNEEARQ